MLKQDEPPTKNATNTLLNISHFPILSLPVKFMQMPL